MLSLTLSEFMIQLKDGSINNVGAPTKSAEVKLFDVSSADARAFGDNRVKLVFGDDDGNDVEVAVFPDEVEALLEAIEEVRQAGSVDGLDPTV